MKLARGDALALDVGGLVFLEHLEVAELVEAEPRRGRYGPLIKDALQALWQAQALLLRHQDMVREAGREREEILKRALQEADSLKNDIVSRAREESERLLQRAKDQIQREKTQAIQDVKGQVADLAVQAAAKIVASSLTPEAQRKLVSEFIEALPKAH